MILINHKPCDGVRHCCIPRICFIVLTTAGSRSIKGEACTWWIANGFPRSIPFRICLDSHQSWAVSFFVLTCSTMVFSMYFTSRLNLDWLLTFSRMSVAMSFVHVMIAWSCNLQFSYITPLCQPPLEKILGNAWLVY